MRVHIYKEDAGGASVLVEPSIGKGLAPVLIRGITAENVDRLVGPVVCEMRGDTGEPSG